MSGTGNFIGYPFVGEVMNNRLNPGTRIRLVRMNDPYPLPYGITGTVLDQDPNGDYEVQWDNGSQLKLIPEIDEWEEIPR